MINILLIDDDQASHVYHKLMIQQAGISLSGVVHVFSVDEAMQHLNTIQKKGANHQLPDYIFVDINMPIKSGYDFIQEYQTLDMSNKSPDIYFVSSTISPFDLEKIQAIDLIKGFKTKFLTSQFFEQLIS